ncbi:MAG: 23S rRNA (adenine(2503)-C(2))-methyltransferase RlmN [Parachlamydiaceae bacterium]|nr:23S rRNA (adenine(2503)-C(2))-methyltransferase RlmN [Parachlamydiaceae bacterium]
MDSKISILTHTRDSFANLIYQKLGKGYEHASIIYQEWYRQGQITGHHPAFKNAKNLLNDIVALTDFSYLSCANSTQEGQTGKFLLKTTDGMEIESVIIPMQAGNTLCVSSQVGCRMGCSFCETGRMGLLRHLEANEIVSQLFVAKFLFRATIRNIVFMGMGEPFDNYDNVMQAIRVLSDPYGLGFGRNHLTISTSGCIDGIQKLMDEKEPIPNLAVSINASNDALRNKLMPINRKHDMKALYDQMHAFCQKTKRQILIAYVLIKDQNDTVEHADELAHYLRGLAVKINVIPYNPQSRDRYQAPEAAVIEAFGFRLRERGYYTLLRQTKGQKIMAACGQLGNVKLRQLIRTSKDAN